MAKRSNKMDCRELSLRGTITLTDHARVVDERIFEYVSPDRTVAWKVTGAWMWPKTVQENTVADVQGALTGSLTTDTVGNWAEMTVTDNREFGWIYTGFYVRSAGVNECLVPIGTPIAEMQFLLDPQTVITNDIFFSGQFLTEDTNSPVREWNYLITLESMRISEQESILQQLKGIGQDVEN